jgi:hypothetical protein
MVKLAFVGWESVKVKTKIAVEGKQVAPTGLLLGGELVI